MRVVHKVPLSVHAPGRKECMLPINARVVHVEAQGEDEFMLSVWFDGDDGFMKTKRLLEFFGTGHIVPDHAIYISTHLFLDGALVLHLFDVTP
jgi:hypothetical protein